MNVLAQRQAWQLLEEADAISESEDAQGIAHRCFCSSQLHRGRWRRHAMGNGQAILHKIRVGQLQGGVIVSVGLTDIDSNIVLYNIPFLFRAYQEVDHVRQRLDPLLIEGLARNGFTSSGLSEGGFAYLMFQGTDT